VRTARALVSIGLITAGAVALLPIAALTLFQARRLYAAVACRICRAILLIHGVKLRLFADRPFPEGQRIYISNHTSTLDLFVLVALGLPNCRFFLSGFLRKIVPLGVIAWLMGTFFTVPQERPEERRRIFKRAAATLRRTKESVYLSPEGGRIVSGGIGHFNKGAFHLATDLHVPIVPMYLHIPASMDPGLGYDARPGTVSVYVLPTIHTTHWTQADLLANRDTVRDLFVRVHEVMRCASMEHAA
jgi:1-acyl-sn-glycerol-3-phosphate acyltransferase